MTYIEPYISTQRWKNQLAAHFTDCNNVFPISPPRVMFSQDVFTKQEWCERHIKHRPEGRRLASVRGLILFKMEMNTIAVLAQTVSNIVHV